MARGRISRLDKSRGFGLIEEDGSLEEVEFHWTALSAGSMEQMLAGQRVQFEKVTHPREPGRSAAVNVLLLTMRRDYSGGRAVRTTATCAARGEG